jgi:hypothetical protein
MKHGFSRIGKLRSEANALGAQVRRSRFQVQSPPLRVLRGTKRTHWCIPSISNRKFEISDEEGSEPRMNNTHQGRRGVPPSAEIYETNPLPGIADFRISDLRLFGKGRSQNILQHFYETKPCTPLSLRNLCNLRTFRPLLRCSSVARSPGMFSARWPNPHLQRDLC